MASLMPICGGLVGLKNENVKISSALIRPKWAYKQQTHIFPHIFCLSKGGRGTTRKGTEGTNER